MQIILERRGFFQRDETGLSLLEIVIAVAIIAIFTTVGVVGFQKVTDNARQTAVESAAQALYTEGHAEKVFEEDDLDAMTASWSARSEGLTATAMDAGNDFCITVENEKYGNTASRGACDQVDAGDENNGNENAEANILAAHVSTNISIPVERCSMPGIGSLCIGGWRSAGEVSFTFSGSVEDLQNGNGEVITNLETDGSLAETLTSLTETTAQNIMPSVGDAIYGVLSDGGNHEAVAIALDQTIVDGMSNALEIAYSNAHLRLEREYTEITVRVTIDRFK